MLSRLAGGSGQFVTFSRCATNQLRPSTYVLRTCHQVVKKEDETTALNIKEGPERDLVNFPRRLRPLYPGKVRMGFIPEEWFQFFYKKTGVTGPYVFGTGLITYLVSKEIYVLEHEFYNGVALGIFIFILIKNFGPKVAAFLDKTGDEIENGWKNYRTSSIDYHKNAITEEKKEQWRIQGQKMLFDAKRENVHLQLEASYRERLVTVYREVKKRLDYQVDVQNASRRIEQSHMVKWIADNVIKSITPQQEKEALQQCVLNLKTLAAKAK